MRLKVSVARSPRHLASVSAVGWAGADEIFSCADDHVLLSTLYPTSMHWFPTSCRVDAQSDIFALSSSDGHIHFLNKMGRIEKSVQAHKGAALMVRWSTDGTGLISCGEDGAVKLWSRNGMLRSVIAQMQHAVYCASFDAASDHVVFPNYDHCYIRSLKAQMAAIKWKAHDGLVLNCDWSPVSQYIITCGEDCKFKLWDGFGRSLFVSISHDFPITSVAWSPDGQCFAVGSYNILLLCDKAGWTHSLEKLSAGSLLSLRWFDDSTQLVCGCGSGQVVHAQIMENTKKYGNMEVVQKKRNVLEVRDVSVDTAYEELEARDRISRFSVGFDYVLVVTTQQLYIFCSKNWNTPVIVDLNEKFITMILQASKIFLMSDGKAMYILNYDGRSLSETKSSEGKSSLINERTTSLSNDTVATLDRGEASVIHLFDPITTKPQGDGKIVHERGINELTLCQCGQLNERLLAFRDSEAGIYVAKVKTHGVSQRIAKIGSSLEQLHFNDTTNMLVGVGDGRIVIWPAVDIAFQDRSLLQRSMIEKAIPGLGRFPVLRSFMKTSVTLRRSDGSEVSAVVAPSAYALLQYVAQSKWDQAIRLCRLFKDDSLWATLAGLSTSAKNLYTSEIAYGFLEEIEKAAMLAEARNRGKREASNAETALLAGKISEAEALLERSRDVFHAIMLDIIMLRWSRALDLALKNGKYLEVVMGYRQLYLKKMGKKETDKRFLEHMKEVEIDIDHVREVVADGYTTST